MMEMDGSALAGARGAACLSESSVTNDLKAYCDCNQADSCRYDSSLNITGGQVYCTPAESSSPAAAYPRFSRTPSAGSRTYIFHLEPSDGSILSSYLFQLSARTVRLFGPDPSHCYLPHCSLSSYFEVPSDASRLGVAPGGEEKEGKSKEAVEEGCLEFKSCPHANVLNDEKEMEACKGGASCQCTECVWVRGVIELILKDCLASNSNTTDKFIMHHDTSFGEQPYYVSYAMRNTSPKSRSFPSFSRPPPLLKRLSIESTAPSTGKNQPYPNSPLSIPSTPSTTTSSNPSTPLYVRSYDERKSIWPQVLTPTACAVEGLSSEPRQRKDSSLDKELPYAVNNDSKDFSTAFLSQYLDTNRWSSLSPTYHPPILPSVIESSMDITARPHTVVLCKPLSTLTFTNSHSSPIATHSTDTNILSTDSVVCNSGTATPSSLNVCAACADGRRTPTGTMLPSDLAPVSAPHHSLSISKPSLSDCCNIASHCTRACVFYSQAASRCRSVIDEDDDLEDNRYESKLEKASSEPFRPVRPVLPSQVDLLESSVLLSSERHVPSPSCVLSTSDGYVVLTLEAARMQDLMHKLSRWLQQQHNILMKPKKVDHITVASDRLSQRKKHLSELQCCEKDGIDDAQHGIEAMYREAMDGLLQHLNRSGEVVDNTIGPSNCGFDVVLYECGKRSRGYNVDGRHSLREVLRVGGVLTL